MKRQTTESMTIFALLLIVLIMPGQALADSDIKKAKDFMQVDMYREAIQVLGKRIQEEPLDAEAHYLLGTCYLKTGNPSGADARFSSAVKVEPGYREKVARVYQDLANASLKSYDLKAAKAHYDKMVEYDSGLANPEFLRQIGYRYLKLAVDSNGYQRESNKESAAKFVGWDRVNQIIPSEPIDRIVIEKDLSDKDRDKEGFIRVFPVGKGNKVRNGDLVEVVGSINGQKISNKDNEVWIFNCSNCEPEWHKTANGYFSVQLINYPQGNDFVIYTEPNIGCKVNVKVSRQAVPKPNTVLLNSWIK